MSCYILFSLNQARILTCYILFSPLAWDAGLEPRGIVWSDVCKIKTLSYIATQTCFIFDCYTLYTLPLYLLQWLHHSFPVSLLLAMGKKRQSIAKLERPLLLWLLWYVTELAFNPSSISLRLDLTLYISILRIALLGWTYLTPNLFIQAEISFH